MCGINGFTSLETSFDVDSVLSAMNRRLEHRGPDGEGKKIFDFGAIGMRRLAIIDRAGGQQPIANEDKSLWIVYNGEIYNFRELRKELEKEGHQFQTRSDTEVIIHLYEQHGIEGFRYLNGIFAFVIADLRKNSFILVRDHFGVKPLYYSIIPSGGLVFSSEISSLLVHPAISRKLDKAGLVTYLSLGYVQDPLTAIANVYQVSPGSYLTWQNGNVRQSRYWNYCLKPDLSYTHEDALEELTSLLKDSVQRQMMSEVPLGAFLSGGIDSSTVAAFASDASNTSIKTFSVKFAEESYDESYYSSLAASHLKSEHFQLTVPNFGFEPEILDIIVEHVGQPFSDTSAIPTYLISKYVRKYVTVCLSGDGGDELFAGYDHVYWAARMIRAKRNIPHFYRAMAHRVFSSLQELPVFDQSKTLRHITRGLGASLYDIPELLFRLRAMFQPEELYMLLNTRAYSEEVNSALSHFRNRIRINEEMQPEEMAISALVDTSMPGDILTKVDRMSMASSLEVRVPLLDYRIGELSARLPLSLKVYKGDRKHLLRKAGCPYLPPKVYSHKKQGFSIPLFKWYNSEFWKLVDYYLGPRGSSPLMDIFDQDTLKSIISQGRDAYAREGVVSHARAASRVWSLLVLARWMDKSKISLN